MGFLSPEKLLLLALLVVLVFGTKGLPAIARRTGKGIRETRDALGIDAIRDDIHDVRSTVTEPLGLTKPADAPGSREGQDEAALPADTPGAALAAKRTLTAPSDAYRHLDQEPRRTSADRSG